MFDWILEKEYADIYFEMHPIHFQQDDFGSYFLDIHQWKHYLSPKNTEFLQSELSTFIPIVWNYHHPQKSSQNGHYHINFVLNHRPYRFVIYVKDKHTFEVYLFVFGRESRQWFRCMSAYRAYETDCETLREIAVKVMDRLTQQPSHRLYWVSGTAKIKGDELLYHLLGPFQTYWQGREMK